MKKIIYVLTVLIALLLVGCGSTGGEDEKDKVVTPPTPPATTVTVPENIDVSKFEGQDITSPAAFFEALASLKGATGSVAVDNLIDAATVFEGIDEEPIGDLLDEMFSSMYGNEETTAGAMAMEQASEVIGQMVKKVSPQKRVVEEETETTPAEVQQMITESIIPRLNTVITKMNAAIAANENIVIPKKHTDNYNVIITPAHIKFLESYVKMMRGWCYFLTSYNLDSGFSALEHKSFESDYEMNGGTYIPKIGDYMFTGIDSALLTVKNTTAANNARADVIAGMNEMRDAINAMPVVEWATLSADYTQFTPIKNFNWLDCPNTLGIPTSLKTAMVKEMNQLISSMNGATVISYTENGKTYNVKVYLGAIFGMDMRNTAKGVMNHFSNSVDLNKQDMAGFATETIGGLLPDGVKKTVDAVDIKIWNEILTSYLDFSKASTFTSGDVPFGNVDYDNNGGKIALLKAGKSGELNIVPQNYSYVWSSVVKADGTVIDAETKVNVTTGDVIIICGYNGQYGTASATAEITGGNIIEQPVEVQTEELVGELFVITNDIMNQITGNEVLASQKRGGSTQTVNQTVSGYQGNVAVNVSITSSIDASVMTQGVTGTFVFSNYKSAVDSEIVYNGTITFTMNMSMNTMTGASSMIFTYNTSNLTLNDIAYPLNLTIEASMTPPSTSTVSYTGTIKGVSVSGNMSSAGN